MISATFEQSTGTICTPNMRIGRAYEQTRFEQQFADQFNLIHANATTQYTLRDPILLFGEEFRLSLHFDQRVLNHCTFQLMSGPARAMGEYPSRIELQDEVDFLVDLYSTHCTGNHITQYPWRHSWEYPWGDITLLLQPQNSSVITHLAWESTQVHANE